MKKCWIIALALGLMITLCVCQEKAPTEEKIIEDIPVSLLTLCVGDTDQRVNIDSLEITRRKPDKDTDCVYATVP